MLSDGPPSLTCCPDGPLTFEPAASLFLAIPFPCRDIHWEATGVRAGFNIAFATIFVNEMYSSPCGGPAILPLLSEPGPSANCSSSLAHDRVED